MAIPQNAAVMKFGRPSTIDPTSTVGIGTMYGPGAIVCLAMAASLRREAYQTWRPYYSAVRRRRYSAGRSTSTPATNLPMSGPKCRRSPVSR